MLRTLRRSFGDDARPKITRLEWFVTSYNKLIDRAKLGHAFIYVLEDAYDRFYIGSTVRPFTRLASHALERKTTRLFGVIEVASDQRFSLENLAVANARVHGWSLTNIVAVTPMKPLREPHRSYQPKHPPGKTRRGRPRKQHPNIFTVHVRLSLALYTAFRISCHMRMKPQAEVLRELVREYVEDFSWTNTRIAATKILQTTQAIKQLVAFASGLKIPLQEQKGTDTARHERQRKRDSLLKMGMDAFDQVYKIAQSEKEAEGAKARIQAYKVLALLGKLNALILKDATDEELLNLMLELEDENASLETMAVEIQARATQEAETAHEPAGPGSKAG